MGYSTTMRYTGMSGVDTASMVTQLMAAEAMRKNSVYQQRQILQYTQDAYRGMSKNVREFQGKFLSFSSTSSVVNMRSTSSFGTNKSKITGADGLELDASKGKVTASGSAKPGDYSFLVNSVASAEKRLGSSMSGNTKLDADLSGKNLDETDSFDVTLNGVTRTIDLADYTDGTDTRKDSEILQQALNDKFGSGKVSVTDTGISVETGNKLSISEGSIKDISGVIGANLQDEITGITAERFYTGGSVAEKIEKDISQNIKFVGKDGTEHEISLNLKVEDFPDGEITREQYLEKLNEEIQAKDPSVGEAKTDAQGRIYFDNNDVESFNGLELDEAQMGKFTVNGKEIEIAIKEEMTKAQYISEINTALKASGNSSITASLDNDTGGVKFKVTSATNETYNINFDETDSKMPGLTGSISLEPTSSIQDLNIETGQSTSISETDTLEEVLGITDDGKININGVEIEYTKDTTLTEFMSSINNSNAKVNLAFSETTGKFSLEGKDTGAINSIKISGDTETLDKMMLTGSNYEEISKATDTEIQYDGITLTRESSTVQIDGISLELNAKSVGETFNVSVSKDNENTVDNIKKFIEAYNEMIEGVQTEVTTNRPKSGSYSYYEPLTEEERSAMSETEQEQWDEKAKAGMLYNDPLLRTFTSRMRSISYEKVELSDGSKISLQDLGITTGDYKEGGKLIIDEEKLTAAIEEHGEDISTLFTKSGEGIADKMNTAIDEAFGTKGYVTEKAGRENSVTTNENALSRAISKKDDELYDLAQYLIDKENHYYTMFSAMEQSIVQSNNQMSYLMSM